MGFVQACDWQKGELIVYRTASGTDVHLRVFDLQRDTSGTAPVCELVDLAPGTKLDQAAVAAAPARHFKSDPLVNPPSLRATRLGGASRSLFMVLGAQGPDELPDGAPQSHRNRHRPVARARPVRERRRRPDRRGGLPCPALV